MFPQTQIPFFLLNSTVCQACKNEDHLKAGHELRPYWSLYEKQKQQNKTKIERTDTAKVPDAEFSFIRLSM
jgi:hypothetical protein